MLKALELAGFKSFADKTRLEFPPGVTCVVGPNGSGKSNVVDAIKWVLGSQSPKALRGSEMTDVIFNGSAGRKPLGAAEVTLEFDNRAELFDLKTPTVRITRRVYRSGESEYLLNGATCRLRDLRTLLAGTGVGAESYNIIEQGRVDAVLRASPKDRRQLFEEAAGVSRFRLKKQEAARRLARVEQNLLRLSDIVDEVEGRLRRVRLQAGKAKRYREQTERLKHLRTELGLADWRVLTGRLETLERTAAEATAATTKLNAEVERRDEQLTQIERESDAATDQLNDLMQSQSVAQQRLATSDAAWQASLHRLDDATRELTSARRTLADTRLESLARQADDSSALLSQVDSAGEELRAARAAGEQAEQQQQRASAEAERLAKELNVTKERLAANQSEVADARRAADVLAVKLEMARSLADGQSPRAQALTADLEAADRQLAQLSKEHDSGSGESERLAAELEQAEANAKRLASQEAELQKQIAGLNARAASHAAELAVLRSADTQVENLRDEIIRLLPSDPASPRLAVRGLVADLLNVDFDTAPMIEAALGPRTGHLVVDNGQTLLASLAEAPVELAARASFQRMDCRPQAAAIDRVDLSELPGVLGRADRFVETDPAFRELVERLLGRCWIVDTLATATKLAVGAGRGLSFVTYRGEYVGADGEIVVGQHHNAAGVLTRRKQIERLEEESAEVAERLAATEQALAEVSHEAADHVSMTDEARRRRDEAFATQTKRSHQLAAFAERRQHLANELQRAQGEVGQAATAAEQLQQQLTETRRRQSAAEVAVRTAQGEIDTLDRQLGESQGEVATATESCATHREATAAAVRTLESLNTQLQQLERDADQRNRATTAAVNALHDAETRREVAELAVLRHRSELASLQLEADGVAQRLSELRRRAATAVDSRRRIARQQTADRRRLEACRSRAQQAELDAERNRLERDTLAERLLEDYGIHLAEAAAATPVDQEIGDREDLEREVSTLRGSVSAVGAVNLESLEELDELESRFAELSAHYQDLAQAKASLERLATRISTESRQLFLTTVQEVRGHFRELFRRLFGGGEADLVLMESDADDPLEAGVEIAASPPGKELRSLSLLSGGEKTLTCVALLLAVFRAKPSPFCVLDEVDAALDESNVGRFASVLNEFLSATQFLVVSHSKKTMTCADTLYGVTMQESGVSKQVAVRFEDVQEDGHVSPSATLRRAA
ncbi:MAG: chromosome segregation protein SMC [Planctomycetota bacterium]